MSKDRERERDGLGNSAATNGHEDGGPVREPYEAPRILKKHSVQRVTLFSGGVATATATITGGG